MTKPMIKPEKKHDPQKLIADMANKVCALSLDTPLIVGIHTGGIWVAERLHNLTQNRDPLCTLDISFYRDDFSRVGLNPEVKSSSLPVAMDDRNIVLVDDVLHTGRTIRAALNEIFSYGRPSTVTLCVLIERPGRELPIQADIVGKQLNLSARENAKLTMKNDKLSLKIVSVEEPQ